MCSFRTSEPYDALASRVLQDVCPDPVIASKSHSRTGNGKFEIMPRKAASVLVSTATAAVLRGAHLPLDDLVVSAGAGEEKRGVCPQLQGRGHSMAPGITAFILLLLIAGWMLATDFFQPIRTV
jgi:hypothetical protein